MRSYYKIAALLMASLLLVGCLGNAAQTLDRSPGKWEYHIQKSPPSNEDFQRVNSLEWQKGIIPQTNFKDISTIWLRTSLPKMRAEVDNIVMYRCFGIYEVYQDDKLLKRFFQLKQGDIFKSDARGFMPLVHLKGDYSGQKLTIRLLLSATASSKLCSQIELLRSQDVARSFFLNTMDFLIAGTIFLVFGFMSLLIYLPIRDLIFLFFSFFSTSLGLLYLFSAEITPYLMGINYSQFKTLANLITMWSPVSILLFYTQIVQKKDLGKLKGLIYFHLCFAVVMTPINLLGLLDPGTVLNLVYYECGVILVLFLPIVLTTGGNYGKRPIWAIVRGLIVISGSFHDLLIELGLNESHYLSHWSFLVFMLILLLEISTEFFQQQKTMQQEQKKKLTHEKQQLESAIEIYSQLQNNDSRQKISSKKIQNVLMVDSDQRQRTFAKLALGGTGINLTFADSRQKVEQLITTNSFDIVFVCEDFIDIARQCHLTNKESEIVLITSDNLSEFVRHLVNYPFITNILRRDEKDEDFAIKSLVTTVSKISNDDYFGLEKYLNWGAEIREITIKDSESRHSIVGTIQDDLRKMGFRRSLLIRSTTIAEEMMTNAIYDAPTKSNGRPKYISVPRTENITLLKEEQSKIRWGYDGISLAISVEDPFGSLQKETILHYLDGCNNGQAGNLNEGIAKSGGGVGLYQIITAADLLIVNIKPGSKTEFIAVLNTKRKRNKTTSFQYFAA